jgi:hypothetical protein
MGLDWAEPESTVNLRHVSASSPDIPLPDMMAHFTLLVCSAAKQRDAGGSPVRNS